MAPAKAINCALKPPSRGSLARKYRAQYTRTAAPTPRTMSPRKALSVSSRNDSWIPSCGIHSQVCTRLELRSSPLDSAAARTVGNWVANQMRWEEHTSELQSRGQLVCRLLL